MRRWFMWIPVLMVASLLFWTLALSLGGMSLMAANKLSLVESHWPCTHQEASADMDGAGSRNGYDPIVVHIEESGEPEDVDDNPGAVAASAVNEAVNEAGEQTAVETASQPGQTAF